MNVNPPSFDNLVSVMEEVRKIHSAGGNAFIIRSGNECYVTTHKHLHQGKRIDIGEFANLIAEAATKVNFDSRVAIGRPEQKCLDDLRKLKILETGLDQMAKGNLNPVQGKVKGFVKNLFGVDEKKEVLKQIAFASDRIQDRIDETIGLLQKQGGQAAGQYTPPEGKAIINPAEGK